MKFIKRLWHSWWCEYHLSKRHKISLKYKHVHKFHLEMAEHHYSKAYGRCPE